MRVTSYNKIESLKQKHAGTYRNIHFFVNTKRSKSRSFNSLDYLIVRKNLQLKRNGMLLRTKIALLGS
jgi:hypothetical protein